MGKEESSRDRERESVERERDLNFAFDHRGRVCQLWLAPCLHYHSTAASVRSVCEHPEYSSSQHHDSKPKMTQLQNHHLVTPKLST